MGTICILLGLILFIGCTGGGFFAANAILSNQLYMTLLGTTSTTTVYIALVGLFALIGLLMCLGLVMNGLIYNRLNKLSASLKKRHHH